MNCVFIAFQLLALWRMIVLLLAYAFCVSRKWYAVAVSIGSVFQCLYWC